MATIRPAMCVCVSVYVWSLYLSLFWAVNVGGGELEYSTLWAYPKIWYAHKSNSVSLI